MSTEGIRKLDVATYKRINGALEKWDWNLKLTPKELQDWEGEASIVPQKVFENLAKVQKACDKEYRDARDLYRQISGRSATDTLAGPMAEKLKQDFEATPTCRPMPTLSPALHPSLGAHIPTRSRLPA